MTFDQLKDLLKTPKYIVITTHHKPDGDALGSSLALYHFLCKLNHTPIVITPTDYPNFIQWLPGNDTVVNFEQQPDSAIDWVNNAQLIFCLDFNKLYRINDLGVIIGNSNAPKILIDHHLEPDSFADYSLWNTEKSSTCESILSVISIISIKSKIN